MKKVILIIYGLSLIKGLNCVIYFLSSERENTWKINSSEGKSNFAQISAENNSKCVVTRVCGLTKKIDASMTRVWRNSWITMAVGSPATHWLFSPLLHGCQSFLPLFKASFRGWGYPLATFSSSAFCQLHQRISNLEWKKNSLSLCWQLCDSINLHMPIVFHYFSIHSISCFSYFCK